MKKKTLVYLAIPYTSESKAVMAIRALISEIIGAKLVQDGFRIFNPIAESSRYDNYFNTPPTWEFWSEHDTDMLSKCDHLLVVQLPGWDKSVGVTAEIAHAAKLGIPIGFIDFKTTFKEIYDAIV